MIFSKVFYKLTFYAGFLLLIVGVLMKFINVESKGQYYTKAGNVVNGSLNGNGTIILGVIVLCFSLFGFITHMKEKQRNAKMRQIEKNEERLGKKYNVFKIRKINK